MMEGGWPPEGEILHRSSEAEQSGADAHQAWRLIDTRKVLKEEDYVDKSHEQEEKERANITERED